MLNVIITALIVASAIWVYLDATKNKIGKIESESGIFNMHAGAWAIVTLLLWIIGFPAYLVKRKALIQKAESNPIEPSSKGLKVGILAVIGGLWVLAAAAAVVPQEWLEEGGDSQILSEVSGVWRADGDGTMLTIDVGDEKKAILFNGEPIPPVNIKSIDENNKIVNLRIGPPGDKFQIWSLRQIWDEQGEGFNLVLTLPDGTQDSLSYVREISK